MLNFGIISFWVAILLCKIDWIVVKIQGIQTEIGGAPFFREDVVEVVQSLPKDVHHRLHFGTKFQVNLLEEVLPEEVYCEFVLGELNPDLHVEYTPRELI
mmetsp:Transcript_40990/g.39526  ORF Transcript_40990/g.39526 Transcript_40990/m.39526 type:complete len:100 (+) Transcript_40990:385-684(+)